jgi:hypothetical protein
MPVERLDLAKKLAVVSEGDEDLRVGTDGGLKDGEGTVRGERCRNGGKGARKKWMEERMGRTVSTGQRNGRGA